MSHPPHMREPTLQLSLPEDGITDGDVVLRFPTEAHIDGLLAAVADPELREAANMPNVAPPSRRGRRSRTFRRSWPAGACWR
jgi:hypothetical protein